MLKANRPRRNQFVRDCIALRLRRNRPADQRLSAASLYRRLHP